MLGELQRRRGPRVLDQKLDSARHASWFLFWSQSRTNAGTRPFAPALPSCTGIRHVAQAWPSVYLRRWVFRTSVTNETTTLQVFDIRVYFPMVDVAGV